MNRKVAKCALLAAFCAAMFGVQSAEAGSPAGKVPLQTYAFNKIYCYRSIGGQQKGYIDPTVDLIKITQINGNWAYGSYPVSGGGRASRWFRLDGIVGDLNFANQEVGLTQNCSVYRTQNTNQTIGTAYNNENVLLVGKSGSRAQIVYRLSNNAGYKMGWIESKYIRTSTPVPVDQTYIWPIDLNNRNANYITTLYFYNSSSSKHSATYSGYPDFDYRDAIDIGVPSGTPVKAVADGRLVCSANLGGKSYGKHVIIEHSGGVYSLYGHLSSYVVHSYGEIIKKGQVIGYSGNTGNSTGAHLHFAISKFNGSNESGMTTWKYFRDKMTFNYADSVLYANKKQKNNNAYSREAVQWLKSHGKGKNIL